MVNEFQQIIQAYRRTDFNQRKAALAIVVGLSGSGYRRPGARMYITDDGRWVGAISGGCLEGDALRKAREVMYSRQARLVTYDTSDPEGENFGIGLGCNGILDVLIQPIDPSDVENPLEILSQLIQDRKPVVLETTLPGEEGRVFVEQLQPTIQLLVFGAGYDAVPLVCLAKQIGWRIIVSDDCVAHLQPKRFSDADMLLAVSPGLVRKQVPIDLFSAAVLLSHNYKYDRAVLQELLQTNIPYIGLLGPKKRGDALLSDLMDWVKPEDEERLFWPVGLDVGAETAQEVALSIVAEIQAFFRQATPRSLKYKNEPIHRANADRVLGGY